MDCQPKNVADNRSAKITCGPNRAAKRGRSPDGTQLDCESRVGDFQSPLDLKFNLVGDQKSKRLREIVTMDDINQLQQESRELLDSYDRYEDMSLADKQKFFSIS